MEESIRLWSKTHRLESEGVWVANGDAALSEQIFNISMA